jgi:hypothetical protein
MSPLSCVAGQKACQSLSPSGKASHVSLRIGQACRWKVQPTQQRRLTPHWSQQHSDAVGSIRACPLTGAHHERLFSHAHDGQICTGHEPYRSADAETMPVRKAMGRFKTLSGRGEGKLAKEKAKPQLYGWGFLVGEPWAVRGVRKGGELRITSAAAA